MLYASPDLAKYSFMAPNNECNSSYETTLIPNLNGGLCMLPLLIYHFWCCIAGVVIFEVMMKMRWGEGETTGKYISVVEIVK